MEENYFSVDIIYFRKIDCSTMLYRLKSYSYIREICTINISGDEYSRWKQVIRDIQYLIDFFEKDGKLNEEFLIEMYNKYKGTNLPDYTITQMERLIKFIKI